MVEEEYSYPYSRFADTAIFFAKIKQMEGKKQTIVSLKNVVDKKIKLTETKLDFTVNEKEDKEMLE